MGGQCVLSFEAKLKRGLAGATITTEKPKDTNIYTEKPHTQTHTRIQGYIRGSPSVPVQTSTRRSSKT